MFMKFSAPASTLQMRGPGYITRGMAARIQMMHKRSMRKNAGAKIPP
jgi:hypothetical protein